MPGRRVQQNVPKRSQIGHNKGIESLFPASDIKTYGIYE